MGTEFGRCGLVDGEMREQSRSQKGVPAESDAGYAGWLVPTESDEERWRA